MALTVTPIKGQPILASWGAEVRDRSNQVFANASEMNAWAAPEGAQALTLDDFTLYVRRGAVWQRPLQMPLGVQSRMSLMPAANYTFFLGPPGQTDWAVVFDRVLMGRRLYMVQFTARVEAVSGAPITSYGGVINVTGTGADAPLQFNGGHGSFVNGQEALVYGWPIERNTGAFRASSIGLFATGGAVGQLLSVAFQHVLVGAPNASVVSVSTRSIALFDQGPA